MATIDEFQKLDIRVGTVIACEVFSKAKKPAYKMDIDFGPLGMKQSSAQITNLYTPEELIGRQVVAVVNFPPRQIANYISEVLVLGAVTGSSEVVLLQPERKVQNGDKIS